MLNYKNDIDPFDEEDWEEIDYKEVLKYGYFINHKNKSVCVEEYKKSNKEKYLGEISSFDNYDKISDKIQTSITNLFNVSLNKSDYYNNLKRYFRMENRLLWIKQISPGTIGGIVNKRIRMNPFKSYGVVVDIKRLIIDTQPISKCIPKPSDYLYSFDQNDWIIKTRFNFLNKKKILKRINNDIQIVIDKLIMKEHKKITNIKRASEYKYKIKVL